MECSMPWQAIIEDDPETGHFTATIAGIPQIIVDATSEEEALRLVREALAFYLEDVHEAGEPLPTTGTAKVVPVDV